MATPFSGSLRSGRGRKFKSEINVVPYIDVMLVLLIIFMVTAPMTDPGVINLPTAGKTTQAPGEYIQISLRPDASATVRISGSSSRSGAAQTVTAASRGELLAALHDLHGAHPDMPVMIAADKEIRYDEVIQVISEAKKIGITRVGLATR